MNVARVDWNRVLVIELSVLVALVLLYIAGQVIERVGHFLLLVAAATVIAFLVAPAVGRLQGAIGSRLAATAIVYLGVLGGIALGLGLLAGPLIREAAAFARELPGHVDRLTEFANSLEQLAASRGIPLQLSDLATQATRQLQAVGAVVLAGTLGAAVAVTSAFADLAVALVLSFYLSVDGPRLRDRLHDRIPEPHRPRLFRLEESVRRVFGGYVRGQLILGISIGLVAGFGAAFLGLPYPVVLGVLAGVFELVPMFGSLLGAIPAVIVSLFQPFPTVLWVILFFFAINQAENYLLAPRITGGSLGLSPLGALVALLIGVELAGFLGALVAVPIAALLLDLTRPQPADIVAEVERPPEAAS